jgi:hypothetical protein
MGYPPVQGPHHPAGAGEPRPGPESPAPAGPGEPRP